MLLVDGFECVLCGHLWWNLDAILSGNGASMGPLGFKHTHEYIQGWGRGCRPVKLVGCGIVVGSLEVWFLPGVFEGCVFGIIHHWYVVGCEELRVSGVCVRISGIAHYIVL